MTGWKGARELGAGEVYETEVKILIVKGRRERGSQTDWRSERTGVIRCLGLEVPGVESG